MAHIVIFILVHKFFNPFQHWRLASEIQFFPRFPIENDNDNIVIFILVHKFFNPFQHWRLASEIQYGALSTRNPIRNPSEIQYGALGTTGAWHQKSNINPIWVLGSGSLEGTNCKKKLVKISLKSEKIEEKYHTGNVVKIALGMTLPIFKPGLG